MSNLKIGQELNVGDIIYRSTPEDKRITDGDTIGNKYDIESFYSIYSIFYDSESESVIYDFTDAYCFGIIVGIRHMSYGFSYPDDIQYNKNIYWKLEKIEPENEGIVLYFKSYRRLINIKLTNTVNRVYKYNAKVDEILEYCVKVNNTGDGYSENNIITTIVPKGLEVDTNKINNNGIYNKENNTITWNLDELGPNEEYLFNYYAKVANDNITEYIGNTYLTSRQVQEKIISDETIVNIENKINIPDIIKNPNTRTGTSIIIISVIIISSISYMVLKRNKKYENRNN